MTEQRHDHGACSTSIDSLLRATARGDEAAFGRLYDRSVRLVLGETVRRCSARGVTIDDCAGRALAEDLVVSVYLDVWARAGQYAAGGHGGHGGLRSAERPVTSARPDPWRWLFDLVAARVEADLASGSTAGARLRDAS
ncbi:MULTISPECIES: hypothetical protein [unclassified Nocardioides]|uniref:hypothetical protein n=1 Tax=unclassified Nocardioides TaxID=2615069 RepID=UPI000703C207|nr:MULTISPECIES: hypothetical protein [unclassified Nocardioides]KQP65630.1 hypothetical protein ASF47_07690 [Nocardioides sp. Leaf285]KQQ42891.1 hypothetical protein ASF50_02400 [Nocardioides sp. Leaf307]